MCIFPPEYPITESDVTCLTNELFAYQESGLCQTSKLIDSTSQNILQDNEYKRGSVKTS